MTSENTINWAGVLIIRDGQILSLKETTKDFYQLPGGKMEPGETPEETVVREVDEELAVTVSNLEKLMEVDEGAKSQDRTMHFILFRGEIGELPDRAGLPPKTETLAWIDSNFESQVSDVGNLLRYHVIPELKQKSLIN